MPGFLLSQNTWLVIWVEAMKSTREQHQLSKWKNPGLSKSCCETILRIPQTGNELHGHTILSLFRMICHAGEKRSNHRDARGTQIRRHLIDLSIKSGASYG
jgi:hypothetical protein